MCTRADCTSWVNAGRRRILIKLKTETRFFIVPLEKKFFLEKSSFMCHLRKWRHWVCLSQKGSNSSRTRQPGWSSRSLTYRNQTPKKPELQLNTTNNGTFRSQSLWLPPRNRPALRLHCFCCLLLRMRDKSRDNLNSPTVEVLRFFYSI